MSCQGKYVPICRAEYGKWQRSFCKVFQLRSYCLENLVTSFGQNLNLMDKLCSFVAVLLLFTFPEVGFSQSTCQTRLPSDIGREIRLSPNSCFDIPFVAREGVHILEATQLGVDLKLQVLNGAGRDAVDPVDSPNRSFGTEVIAFLGEADTKYTIRVSWVAPDATYKSDGSFILRELNKSPGQDSAEFVESLQLASNLLVPGNREKLLKSTELFTSMLRVSGQVEWLKYRLALASHMLGRSFRDRGENAEAVPLFERIGSLVNGSHINGEALSDLGLALYRLGRYEESRIALEKSLPITKSHGNQDDLALAHARLTITLNNLGRTSEALATIAAAEKIGDVPPVTRLTVLNNKGLVLAAVGRRGEALEVLLPLPDKFYQLGKPLEATFSLSIIIGIYEAIAAFDEARTYLNKSLDSASSLPSPAQARSINYYFLGRLEKEPIKAISNFEKALVEYRTLNDRNGQATVLNQIGMQYHRLGAATKRPHPKALENFRNARVILSDLRNQGELAAVLNNVGAELMQLGQLDEALTYFLQARMQYRSTQGKAGEADTLHNIMEVWDKRGSRRIAITYGRESVNLYQQLRANIDQLDRVTQDNYFKSVSDTYRRLAGLLVSEGLLAEAERVMELLKVREVNDFQGGAETSEFLSVTDLGKGNGDAVEKVNAAGAEVFAISSEIEKLEAATAPDGETERRLESLRRQLKIAKDEFRKFLADLSKRIGAQSLAVNQLDSRLQVKLKRLADQKATGLPILSVTTIVEKDRINVILTTPAAQRARSIKLNSTDLNQLVSAFRNDLIDRNSTTYKQTGQRLYDVLIKPIEGDIGRTKPRTILWSLDGALRYLPVAALYDEKQGYLAQRVANVVVSLGETEVITSERRPEWVSSAFGVSKGFENFADLLQVADELDCIIEQPGNKLSLLQPVCTTGLLTGTKYIDDGFTGNRFIEVAKRSNHLHLATHFELGKNIAESYLLLGGGDPRRFFMRDLEDNGSFQNSDLVYLSACNTGTPNAGDDGREVESFASIVQKLGAQSVISTQWLVSHRSTTRFNRTFYSNYVEKKLNKAESIRQAQLSHAGLPDLSSGRKPDAVSQTEYSHPYFWSPFILYGNWK